MLKQKTKKQKQIGINQWLNPSSADFVPVKSTCLTSTQWLPTS